MRRFVLAELRQRVRATAALAGGAFLFMLVVAGSYQAFFAVPKGVDANGFLRQVRDIKAFNAFSGSRDVDLFSPHHFLAFGFNHPLFLVLSLSLAVSVGASSVAADVESGRAELLYARPVPRSRLLIGRVAVWLAAEVVVLATAGLGALAGSRLSSDMRAAGVGHLGLVVLQALPVTAFFACLGFLVSAWARSRTVAIGVTVGVTTVAYLANFASLVWSPVAWLHHLTPFGFYEPVHTIDHGYAFVDAFVLIAAAVGFVFAAAWRTNRRDLV